MPAVVHTQVARLRRDIGADHVLTSESGYRVTGWRWTRTGSRT